MAPAEAKLVYYIIIITAFITSSRWITLKKITYVDAEGKQVTQLVLSTASPSVLKYSLETLGMR